MKVKFKNLNLSSALSTVQRRRRRHCWVCQRDVKNKRRMKFGTKKLAERGGGRADRIRGVDLGRVDVSIDVSRQYNAEDCPAFKRWY